MTTPRFVTEKKRCRETLPSLPQGGFRSPVFKHKPNITISCFKNLNRRKCSRFPARLYPKVKHYDSFFQTLNRRKGSRFPARLYSKAKHYDSTILFQKLKQKEMFWFARPVVAKSQTLWFHCFKNLNKGKCSGLPARLYPKAKHYDFFLFQKLIKWLHKRLKGKSWCYSIGHTSIFKN